jgi:hypothetical protein
MRPAFLPYMNMPMPMVPKTNEARSVLVSMAVRGKGLKMSAPWVYRGIGCAAEHVEGVDRRYRTL